MNSKIEYLELCDKKDFEEYHKGLYKAFVQRYYDEWLVNHYELKNDKLIPTYDNTITYAIKEDNKIIGAVGVNIDRSKLMQIEQLTFKISSEDTNKKVCEGINMYIAENVKGEQFNYVFAPFLDYILQDLKEKGYEVFYHSCASRMRGMSLLAGFTEIDVKNLDNEDEYLFKIDL